MKISYLAYFPDYFSREKGGPKKKVKNQVRALRRHGHEVGLIVMDPRGPSRGPAREEEGVRLVTSRCGLVSWPVDLVRGLRRALYEQQPEVIYLRYPNGIPGISAVLRAFPAPVVVEMNGDFERTCLYKSEYGKYLLERTFGRQILRVADGFVGVTPELNNIYSERLSSRFRKQVTIGNGYIEEERRPLPDSFPTDEDRFHLCFVGRGRPWNGLDRVLNMYRREQPEDLVLHWCSDHSYESFDIPSDQIVREGYLEGVELSELLYRCDVGIGSLAMFRRDLHQGSNLKVRTYLIHGLPVLLGHEDPDLPDDAPFVETVPELNDPLRSEMLKSYAERVREEPEVRRQARRFAEKHLSYKTKMKKLVKFLRIVKESHEFKKKSSVS